MEVAQVTPPGRAHLVFVRKNCLRRCDNLRLFPKLVSRDYLRGTVANGFAFAARLWRHVLDENLFIGFFDRESAKVVAFSLLRLFCA